MRTLFFTAALSAALVSFTHAFSLETSATDTQLVQTSADVTALSDFEAAIA